MKELSPSTKIIAIDPKGSILAEPSELNDGGVGFYEVEGIGYALIDQLYIYIRKYINK